MRLKRTCTSPPLPSRRDSAGQDGIEVCGDFRLPRLQQIHRRLSEGVEPPQVITMSGRSIARGGNQAGTRSRL